MDDLHREAQRLLDIIHGYCGENCTPQVLELRLQARKLYDLFEMHKNTRDLENQANLIKEMLYHLHPGAMTTPHCEDLKHHYEKLRINLRQYQ